MKIRPLINVIVFSFLASVNAPPASAIDSKDTTPSPFKELARNWPGCVIKDGYISELERVRRGEFLGFSQNITPEGSFIQEYMKVELQRRASDLNFADGESEVSALSDLYQEFARFTSKAAEQNQGTPVEYELRNNAGCAATKAFSASYYGITGERKP